LYGLLFDAFEVRDLPRRTERVSKGVRTCPRRAEEDGEALEKKGERVDRGGMEREGQKDWKGNAVLGTGLVYALDP